MSPQTAWPPTKFRRFERFVRSSTGVAIVQTDAGRGYLKAMGNDEGPHALAKDLVGTRLARWFGLPTLDEAVLLLEKSDVYPLPNRRLAQPGPAFITRAVRAVPWSGAPKRLKRLANPDDLTRLVVFDTWLLNSDRYPRTPPEEPSSHPAARSRQPNRDNVLLEWTGHGKESRLRLVAMDFTHAFNSGQSISARMHTIAAVQDDGVYGLFPELIPLLRQEVALEAAQRLREVERKAVESVLQDVPDAWQVDSAGRLAWCDLIYDRAARLDAACGWGGGGGQMSLFLGGG